MSTATSCAGMEGASDMHQPSDVLSALQAHLANASNNSLMLIALFKRVLVEFDADELLPKGIHLFTRLINGPGEDVKGLMVATGVSEFFVAGDSVPAGLGRGTGRGRGRGRGSGGGSSSVDDAARAISASIPAIQAPAEVKPHVVRERLIRLAAGHGSGEACAWAQAMLDVGRARQRPWAAQPE